MIISTVSASNCTPQTIVIGRRGTYETMQIVFDLTYLIENYGNGTAVLAIKRSQDESAYPAVVTQEDNILTWTITETDTYYVGSGECQLMWYVDGGLAKTIIYPMVVMRDILSTTEEPPDGYENWIEHLTELGAETQQNAQDAEQSAYEAKASENSAAESAQRAEDAAGMLVDVSATATTLEPGQPATAEYDEGVFKFGIPKGDKLTYADLTEADKEDLVQGPIKDAQDDAVEAVGTAKNNAVDAVNQAGTTQKNAVNQAGTTAVNAVGREGTTQVERVTTEGNTQVGRVQDKGDEVIASIPSDYSDLTAEVDDLSRQLNDSTTGLDTKAPVILETASGAIASFNDGAASMPVRKLVAQIEPVQAGTGDPSPDNVRPISGWMGANISDFGDNLASEVEVRKPSPVYSGSNLLYVKFPVTIPAGTNLSISFVATATSVLMTNTNIVTYRSFTGTGAVQSLNVSTKVVFQANTAYALIKSNQNDNIITDFSNVMINYGTTPLPYVPAVYATLPITFTDPDSGDPLTIYGGTITINEDRSADLVSNMYKFTADGSTYKCDIKGYNSDSGLYYYRIKPLPQTVQAPYVFDCSSMFKPTRGIQENNAFYTNKGNNCIYCWRSENITVAQFNEELAASPVEFCIKSATNRTYHFDNVDQLKTFLGVNNVWCDTGDITELVYPADTKLFLTARDEEITESIAPIENGTTASKAYAAGDYFFHDTKFCKALTAIASGATFTSGTNYTETTVAAELLAAQN